MNEVVLDASALIVLLNDEPGAGKVAEVVTQTRIAALNLEEVIEHFRAGGMTELEVDDMLRPLPLTIVPTDDGLAHIADRFAAMPELAKIGAGAIHCLALAKRDGLPAVTADKQWRTIAEVADVKLVVAS